MLVCKKTDGKKCKDNVKPLCNGLVADCKEYTTKEKVIAEKPLKKKK